MTNQSKQSSSKNYKFSVSVDELKIDVKKEENIITVEGPPFPTGEPHWGHVLVGIIKSLIHKIYKMLGYTVEPVRAGFDVNGIGVETIVENMYDTSNMDLGDKLYKCQKLVLDNISKWEYLPDKIGRELDVKNYWATNQPSYVKSVLWAFKELYKKGLVCSSKKICNYSIGAGTNISESEAKENKQILPLDCITYTYKLKDSNDKIIVWTTTPWTISSNTICCVGKDIDYVKIRYKDENYIISKYAYENNKVVNFEKKDCKIIETFKGQDLIGREYEPIFTDNPFAINKIYHGDFINEEKGSGITHIVPAFGSDDLKVCIEEKFVDKKMTNLFDPIDQKGYYTNQCPKLEGLNIFSKELVDKVCEIIKKSGNLCMKSTTQKEQNVCPRTDVPLISRARDSLFLRTTSFQDRMIELVKQANFPEFAKKMMINWLENNVDWDFARKNKVWGIPIPMWIFDDEVYIPDSVEELEQKCGKKLDNFFVNTFDSLEILSSKGHKMIRYPAVFDCWWDSGCAPFASKGYPFENKDAKIYPLDYIAESHDQVRGWFYSLLVFAVGLFDTLPYKNVYVTGMVLADDKTKMSKRKQNYKSPNDVLKEHGADAVRLYMIGSPVVEGGSIAFTVEGVKDCSRNIIKPLFNCKYFLDIYTNLYKIKNKTDVQLDKELNSEEDFDKWLFARTVEFEKEMKKNYYSFTFKYLPGIVQSFVDDLNNWYIKFMRNTLKGLNGQDKALKSLSTLYKVLGKFAYVIEPLMPFTSKELNIEYKEELPFCPDILREQSTLKKIVTSIRDVRDKYIKKNNKYPIKDITVYGQSYIVNKYIYYIMSEVNSDIIVSKDFDEKIIEKIVTFNKLKFMKNYNKTSNFKDIVEEIKEGKFPEEKSYPKSYDTEYKVLVDTDRFNKYISEEKILVTISKEQETEDQNIYYKLRCIYSHIQQMRGRANLQEWNKICIRTDGLNNKYLESLLTKETCCYHYKDLVLNLLTFLKNEKLDDNKLLEESVEGCDISLYLSK